MKQDQRIVVIPISVGEELSRTDVTELDDLLKDGWRVASAQRYDIDARKSNKIRFLFVLERDPPKSRLSRPVP